MHALLHHNIASLKTRLGTQSSALLEDMLMFIEKNSEMKKMVERQCLVPLKNFSIEYETSLEGIFGVSESLRPCSTAHSCSDFVSSPILMCPADQE